MNSPYLSKKKKEIYNCRLDEKKQEEIKQKKDEFFKKGSKFSVQLRSYTHRSEKRKLSVLPKNPLTSKNSTSQQIKGEFEKYVSKFQLKKEPSKKG